jgi:hypothetical protein
MSNRSAMRTCRAIPCGSMLGLALCGVVLGQSGSGPTANNIITFNVPGAGAGFRQGTTATSINAAGAI